MSQTLTVSESLYRQLETSAHDSGFNSLEEFIQELFEAWQARLEELHYRQETVRRIDTLREQLFTKYAEMQDSVDLIRADRER